MISSVSLSSFSKIIAVGFVIILVYYFSSMERIASGPEDLHSHKVVLASLIHQARVSVLNSLLQL